MICAHVFKRKKIKLKLNLRRIMGHNMATLSSFGAKACNPLNICEHKHGYPLICWDTTMAVPSLFGDMTDVTVVPFYNSHYTMIIKVLRFLTV